MNSYVLLSKLTSEGARSLWNQPRRVREVNQEIEELGCRVVSQFATLGPYDFVTIIQAPDNDTCCDCRPCSARAARSRS